MPLPPAEALTVTATLISDTTPTESPSAPLPTVPTPLMPDIPTLQQSMLDLVNQDRQANGLAEVTWDNTAATAGLRHAQEMARFGYLSHWNLEGHGPDYRYSLAGGLDTVRENVYMYTHSPGGGPTLSDGWQRLIREAQQTLMGSPMHRENILSPEHTHVGIGIAYEPTTCQLSIAQEFIDRYVILQPLPHRISLGDQVSVSGHLGSGSQSPLLNLAYGPAPQPMTVDELKKTGTYSSQAENYDALALTVKDGRFVQPLALDHQGQTGLYYIRIWVTTELGEVLANQIVVNVE